LPKPAVIKQSRYYGGSNGFFTSAGLKVDDVVLCALPIYHGNGTILGVGCAITSGSVLNLIGKLKIVVLI
jgi:hypothetical protein